MLPHFCGNIRRAFHIPHVRLGATRDLYQKGVTWSGAQGNNSLSSLPLSRCTKVPLFSPRFAVTITRKGMFFARAPCCLPCVLSGSLPFFNVQPFPGHTSTCARVHMARRRSFGRPRARQVCRYDVVACRETVFNLFVSSLQPRRRHFLRRDVRCTVTLKVYARAHGRVPPVKKFLCVARL